MRSATTTAFGSSGAAIDSRSSRWIRPHGRRGRTDGLKLERLHGYWFHRAIEAFVADVAADPGRWAIGRPENADANRLAWVRALQAQLRLREAYGVDDEVSSESGQTVIVFEALLSLNLMSVFFQRDFLVGLCGSP